MPGVVVSSLFLLLGANCGIAVAASAAPLTSTSLGPVADWAGGLLLTVLGTLSSAALAWLCNFLRLRADSEVRAYLEMILQRGISFARAEIARSGRELTIDTHSEVMAIAAGYVIQSAPDALRRFGISEERVRQLVSARLPPLKIPDPSQ